MRDAATIREALVMVCSSKTAAQQERDKALAAAEKADTDAMRAERRIAMYEGQITGLLDELLDVRVAELEAMVTP
ncbi:MAG: hypothetical protein ACXVXO_12515 [Mycobacteriaceae bacterium]